MKFGAICGKSLLLSFNAAHSPSTDTCNSWSNSNLGIFDKVPRIRNEISVNRWFEMQLNAAQRSNYLDPREWQAGRQEGKRAGWARLGRQIGRLADIVGMDLDRAFPKPYIIRPAQQWSAGAEIGELLTRGRTYTLNSRSALFTQLPAGTFGLMSFTKRTFWDATYGPSSVHWIIAILLNLLKLWNHVLEGVFPLFQD